MTTARELYDNLEPATASMISPSEGGSWVIQPGEDQATILRALDLLARVEESEDELVRELERMALPDPHDERSVPHAPLCRKAAAALVALKAERDWLKAHAEAMYQSFDECPEGMDVDAGPFIAYRRDFPKDAP